MSQTKNSKLKKTPKISVIIPVYKVEKYLSRCLDSVLKQTFKDFEAICVNDGSPDKCGEILKKYAKKDSRIKVITQKNKGLSVARNNGIRKALGDYVCFLDSDDYIHPQLLEICYKLANKTNSELVSYRFIGAENQIKQKSPLFDIDKIKYLITEDPLYFRKEKGFRISLNACTKFYKKDLIKGLEFIPHITMEDYPFVYALFKKHPRTLALDISLYYYTYNPISISHISCSKKKIMDYQTGLNYVYNTYKNAPKKEWKFILKTLFPSVLKHQFEQIKSSPKNEQEMLFKTFALELAQLKENNCLSWRGHKLKRYFMYKKLIKTFGSKK